jgi:hypothetical protein
MHENRVVEDIIAFTRYLSWADLVRSAHNAEFRKGSDEQATATVWGPEFAWMAYWYSSLFVVIEAYESIGWGDPIVDTLLEHPGDYRNLLRRFRNGIFHYQSDLVDSRLLDLLNTGEDHVIWVHALHEEFKRLLREQIATAAINTDLKIEWERTLRSITGWLPEESELLKLYDTLEKMHRITRKDPMPGLEDKHAEMLQDIREIMKIRGTFEEKRERLRRQLLYRLGITVADSTSDRNL